MAIDFRVRPPYGKGFSMSLFKGIDLKASRLAEAPLAIGRRRIASAVSGSMDTFMAEMDDAGIDVGVLMGRKTNHPAFGNSDNQ